MFGGTKREVFKSYSLDTPQSTTGGQRNQHGQVLLLITLSFKEKKGINEEVDSKGLQMYICSEILASFIHAFKNTYICIYKIHKICSRNINKIVNTQIK